MRTESLRTVTPLRQIVSQTAGPSCGPVSRKTLTIRGDTRPLPPLRLTRRGRIVVAAAAALLVSALMAVAASAAQAAGPGGHGHARGSGRQPGDIAVVTVLPGDSLWSVAVRTAPNADARIVIQEIIQLNHVPGTFIYPGERLRVPSR